MTKALFAILILLIMILLFWQLQNNRPMTPSIDQPLSRSKSSPIQTTVPHEMTAPTIQPIPQSYTIPQKLHVAQTFNNCGPATLSMQLSYYGINVSQQELGSILRPYQNPQGDNDDKSVEIPELAAQAKKYSLLPYIRSNGSIEIVKQFIAHDIPVVTRTWLHPNEDIGHYRLVRGYDDQTQELIQDDSYEGKNLRFSYEKFLNIWQPFHYEYFILVSKDKEELAKTIIGKDIDEKVSWQQTLAKAKTEAASQPENPYPVFNQAVSYYYLEDYPKAVSTYERIAAKLPKRMLWYQIEPIQAYEKTDNYEKVFALTDQILSNQNRAFSELYLIRGNSYLAQHQNSLAKGEFEKAVLYNKNFTEAITALKAVSSL